jgi:hypothetical protein
VQKARRLVSDEAVEKQLNETFRQPHAMRKCRKLRRRPA